MATNLDSIWISSSASATNASQSLRLNASMSVRVSSRWPDIPRSISLKQSRLAPLALLLDALPLLQPAALLAFLRRRRRVDECPEDQVGWISHAGRGKARPVAGDPATERAPGPGANTDAVGGGPGDRDRVVLAGHHG